MRLLVLLGLATCAATAADVSARAMALHRDSLVFDGHVHVINRQFYDHTDISDALPRGQFDLPRAREGGLGAFFFSLYIAEEYYPGRYETRQVLRLYDLAARQLEKNKATIEMALNATEIERIRRSGKIAAVLDLEGGFDLDGDLGVLRTLHRLGFRSLQLSAHNWTNQFADSCCAPAKSNGLTEHGRALVREMNRLGMVINISHAADTTIEQALAVSTDPLVATHHGMRALNNIPRTMPDALMKKVAAKGGVIGFHMGNEFHNRKMFDWRTKQEGKAFWDTSKVRDKVAGLSIFDIDKLTGPHFPDAGMTAPKEVLFTVDGWIAVIDRAIQVVGEDHVAIGSDFDGGPTLPLPMRDVRDLPLLTDAMLRRGYSDERIRKFLGDNLLRVFRRVTEKR